jgi:hypothetical protein
LPPINRSKIYLRKSRRDGIPCLFKIQLSVNSRRGKEEEEKKESVFIRHLNFIYLFAEKKSNNNLTKLNSMN